MAKEKVAQVAKVQKVSQVRKKSSEISTSSKKEPQTMEELLAQYGGNVKGFSQGNKVKGRVIAKLPGRLILDIGGKSEGVVAEKAYKEAERFIKTLEMGDEVEASVIIPETPDGFTILSLRAAAGAASWEKLQKAKVDASQLEAEVKGVNPSGVVVEIYGLTGFIPNSQLGKQVSQNKNALVGKKVKVSVVEIDRAANKIVLSEKAVSEAEDMELARKALEEIKEGEIYEGIVTSVYDFGCFVKLDVPVGKKEKASLEGLVHISEMAWEKVDDIKKLVSQGDSVKVKIIGKKDSKLALSIKQTLKDPWEKAADKYKADMKVKGKVVKVSDFGVFVSLEPGVEGLVHMTKIPPGMKFSEGDEANVYVEEVDTKVRKISLGLVLTTKPVGYK